LSSPKGICFCRHPAARPTCPESNQYPVKPTSYPKPAQSPTKTRLLNLQNDGVVTTLNSLQLNKGQKAKPSSGGEEGRDLTHFE
jgi:hypothetical protein